MSLNTLYHAIRNYCHRRRVHLDFRAMRDDIDVAYTFMGKPIPRYGVRYPDGSILELSRYEYETLLLTNGDKVLCAVGEEWRA